MKLLSCLPVFIVFICHAEKAIYGETNDIDPEINKRDVLNAGGKTQSFMVLHRICIMENYI